ncbi:CRISPR-associated protein Cas5 [Methanococcus maripaludis KA1]|uniref:CRISPR-associated protein Cas5 n=1 Tax=Methanococcus maripaludis KA1 TaxID=637914 RepID=A0A2Z5PHA6_METMI|nr:CRISPR-associated protein Cas5 [Methanococcus maripaludis KA1]
MLKLEKALVFDIWSEYAHFKKYYTTTSPLTYAIPSKTSIYGIIGSIIGLDKNSYLNYFQEGACKIGLQILNPVKKTRISINLIDTKKANLMSKIRSRTQIRTEFLKDAKYRVYIRHTDNNVYDELKKNLENHTSTYTVSLGLSECLANFNYLGEFPLECVFNNKEWVNVSSAVRIDGENIKKEDIDFTKNGEYFSDKVAIEMKPNREVTDYGTIVYERNGNLLRVKPSDYYRINQTNIVLF